MKSLITALALVLCTGITLAAEEYLKWHFSYEEALEESKRSGKPMLVEFRCAPCVNGREFDAKVLYTAPDSTRGKLLQKYVRARIHTMEGVDIGHFDRDWHNSIYYFIINSNEDIYLRYGGRGEESAHTYLNLESFELALQLGIKEHTKHLAGERPTQPRHPKRVPNDYPLLRKNVSSTGRCVECHLIADYRAQEKQIAGILDPITDLYQSPDIKTIGIHLDIPKGLLIENAEGPAAEAGIQSGDTITAINGIAVLTFGDLQYRYNQLDRNSTSFTLQVARREQPSIHTIDLPFEWWKTDLEFRHWSLETVLYAALEELGTEEKQELQLPLDGFASRVISVDFEAFLGKRHSLKGGDIITAVNGRTSDPRTRDLNSHVQLNYRGGETLKLTILRGGNKMQSELHTGKNSFRKAEENVINPDKPDVTWSAPAFIQSGQLKPVRYRAAVANDHLIVEAKHQPEWHSYAMDNPQRAIAKNGQLGDQELPTKITLPSSLVTSGGWLQSRPQDYSKPDIRWFSWGFTNTSYFAIKLTKLPKSGFEITIDSQACNADTCAGANDLRLEVPATTNTNQYQTITDLLVELEPVQTSSP